MASHFSDGIVDIAKIMTKKVSIRAVTSVKVGSQGSERCGTSVRISSWGSMLIAPPPMPRLGR